MCSCVGMGHDAVLASFFEAIWDAGSERQCGKTLMSMASWIADLHAKDFNAADLNHKKRDMTQNTSTPQWAKMQISSPHAYQSINTHLHKTHMPTHCKRPTHTGLWQKRDHRFLCSHQEAFLSSCVANNVKPSRFQYSRWSFFLDGYSSFSCTFCKTTQQVLMNIRSSISINFPRTYSDRLPC